MVLRYGNSIKLIHVLVKFSKMMTHIQFLVYRFSPCGVKNDKHRTYAVGVLSLRQSGTLHFMCAVFPRVARKNRTPTIGTYHAVAG